MEELLFEAGHLSLVLGAVLTDGREVVVKVRPWQQRLSACAQVHRIMFGRGFPCPQPLAGPDQEDGLAFSAETLIREGGARAVLTTSAPAFAEGLAEFIRLAPGVEEVSSLLPVPPWADYRISTRAALWPPPDDRDGDLNAAPGTWIDDVAQSVGLALEKVDARPVVGHVDWYSDNLAWREGRLAAVYDWDSVAALPEPAIAGLAAAVWSGIGPGEPASVAESEAFLDHFFGLRPPRAPGAAQVSWAAGLWVRCFDAKKALLSGGDPDQVLTRAEANERLRRAGLLT